MSKVDGKMVYEISTFGISHICAKLGLDALISSRWIRYLSDNEGLENDD